MTERATIDSSLTDLIAEVETQPATYDTALSFWALLRRNGWKIKRQAALAAAVACLVAFLYPPYYESQARLMPPESQNAATRLASLASAGGGANAGLLGATADLLGSKNTAAMFVGVLRSTTVQDAIVNRFDLRRVYWTRYYEVARSKLSSRTEVSEDRKSGIITILVRDRDPDRARAIADAYVDELNAAVASLSTSSARKEREFLEQRLRIVHQDLIQAAEELSRYSSQKTAIDLPEQAKAMLQSAGDVEGQLIAAQTELAGLSQIYADGNVRVRALRARIRELRQQVQRLAGTPGGGGEGVGVGQYPSIRQLPVLAVQYAELYRSAKIQESVFQTLTIQYELARVQEAKEIPTVRLLDPANTPERRSGPNRAVLLFVVFGTWMLMAFLVLSAKEAIAALDADHPLRVITGDIRAPMTFWKRSRRNAGHFSQN